MYKTILKLVLKAAIASFVATATVPQSIPESRISIPFTLRLDDLANYAERALPGTLHRREYGRTCVEPKRLCTKVPEFSNFKMKMRNRCVEVSPRINCTITEEVRREGPLRVSGSGGKIVLGQDIFGSGTVRGRGEIGRHIRQTVRARAEMTVTASPGLAANWEPVMPVSISYRWIDRPEFRLANVIPITLGSMLGRPLDQALRKFEAEQLPSELAELDIRSEAATIWQTIQEPQQINLPGDVTLYLHLRPHAIGLDGPTFNGGLLKARLSLMLHAEVNDGAAGTAPIPLPNLTTLPDSGVDLTVPVTLSADTLDKALVELLPRTVALSESPNVTVKVHSAVISIAGELLQIDLTADVATGILSLTSQSLRLVTRPVLDAEKQTLTFSDIDFSIPGHTLTALAKKATINALKIFLDDTVAVAYEEEVGKLEEALSKALNRELAPGLRLSGGGNLDVSALNLDANQNAIQVILTATGEVQIVGFALR